MRPRVRRVLILVGLAALYIAGARLGLVFNTVAGFATLVWPPSGIALAAMLLFGMETWPAIFVGSVIANALSGAPILVALGIGVGNTAQSVLATLLLRRTPGFSVTLETVRSVIALIILAATLSTLISATVGILSLFVGHVISISQVRATWRAWWIGDTVGILVFAPIILVWAHAPLAQFPRRWLERFALSAAVIVFSALTFFSGAPHVPTLVTPFHQVDVLLAVMIWAAMRFGQRGASTASFVLSVTAVAGTALGFGPFARDDVHLSLLSLQTFMPFVSAIFLILGAMVAEWRAEHARALAEHEDAVQANRAKSEFLKVMSHELRTPLNAIAGYTALMTEGVYGPLNEQQLDTVARIERNEKQLLSLVNDVLGFVSAEKGEVSVHCESIQGTEAFDAVLPLVKQDLVSRHSILTRDRIRSGLAVQADPKSLQQILVNFLSNASKYGSDGGTITIGAQREGTKVRIWVRDTGVGIPQGEIERVFEPFFQAERGTTRRFPGVGLGLTIARDLAQRMNGDVTIASELGAGTTASVLLPAA